MNNVSLVGRLTRDPELRTFGDENRSVCEIRLAINDGKGDSDPLYIDVSTFDKQAEACAEYLSKGRQVAVVGSLRYDEWEKDGFKRSKHSVVGRVEFLSTARGNGRGPEAVAVGADREDAGAGIPF